MGSTKKSEGIALLSMYNDEDEDEDDEMEEDIGEDQEQEAGPEQERQSDIYTMVEDYRIDTNETAASVEQSTSVVACERLTPTLQFSRVNNVVSPQQLGVVALNLRKGSTRGSINIVNYGHDEVAMSPEPEDGEIEGSGVGGEHEHADGEPPNGMSLVTTQAGGHVNQGSNQFNDALQSDEMQHDAMAESDVGLLDETSKEEKNVVDPLDRFLPIPPKAKCSDELQRKINKFLEYKKAGKSFNAEVRNRKDYRNPDFLLHAVTYQEIDDLGSCFSNDVFDPHGYDLSDYYGQIEVDMRRESERKEQERKKAQKVDFISGGSQQGTMASAARINLPVSGFSNMVVNGMPLVLPTTDAGNRDSRQNKKSKWDKVDGDQIIPLASTGQSSVSNVGSHAAMLSAANAGGGYMVYAQQKRREVEEKRSSERRLERRS